MYRFKNSLIALIGLVSLMTVATALMPHVGYGSGGTATTSAPAAVNFKIRTTSWSPTVIWSPYPDAGAVQSCRKLG